MDPNKTPNSDTPNTQGQQPSPDYGSTTPPAATPQVYGPTQSDTPAVPDTSSQPSTTSYAAQSSMPPSGGNGKKMLLRIVIIVIVIAVLGVGGYFGYKALKGTLQKGKVSDAVSQSNAKAKASGATDIASLSNVTLTAPAAALANLTASTSANPGAKIYTTADQSCLLIYGTGDTKFIPGSDVTAVVNQYLDNIRKAGASVQGPDAADPRIFSAASGSQKYSMPSLTFSFTQTSTGKKGRGYFSAAVLKNGDRAIVETGCFADSGDVPQSQMDAMEAIAKQITVSVQ